MTLFDWLFTGEGIALEHAVIVLLVALTGFVQGKTHQRVKHLEAELNGKQDKRRARKAPAGAATEVRPVAPPSQRQL